MSKSVKSMASNAIRKKDIDGHCRECNWVLKKRIYEHCANRHKELGSEAEFVVCHSPDPCDKCVYVQQ